MTLNASGFLELAGSTPGTSIAAELSRVGQAISLQDTDVYALAGKTVGTGIDFPTDFYGKSAGGGGGGGGIQTLIGRSWSEHNTGASGSGCLCWLEFFGDGSLYCMRGKYPTGESNFQVYADDWFLPHGGSSSTYWIRATPIPGYDLPNSAGTPDSAVGVWLQLNAVRSWTAQATTTGGSDRSRSVGLTVELAATSGGTVLTSANYFMSSLAMGLG